MYPKENASKVTGRYGGQISDYLTLCKTKERGWPRRNLWVNYLCEMKDNHRRTFDRAQIDPLGDWSLYGKNKQEIRRPSTTDL